MLLVAAVIPDSLALAIEPTILTHLPMWIQAGAAVVAAVVGLVLLKQLSLLREQVRLTRVQMESAVQWNKLNAAFMYYNSDLVLQRENDVANALERLGINFHTQREPLSLEQVDAIVADVSVFAPVKNFLGLIEDYCTAVRIGAIDEDAAFAMNSALIMRWASVFRVLIDNRRVESNDPEAFCEIEKLAAEWRAKDEERVQVHQDELAAARQRLETLRGVQRKV